MEGHTEGTGTEDALLKVRKEGSGSGGGCEAEASRCAEKPTLAWGGKQRHSESRVRASRSARGSRLRPDERPYGAAPLATRKPLNAFNLCSGLAMTRLIEGRSSTCRKGAPGARGQRIVLPDMRERIPPRERRRLSDEPFSPHINMLI